MPCLCCFCKRNKPRDPESQQGCILNPFRQPNLESPATSSRASKVYQDLLVASELEIIKENTSLPVVFYNPRRLAYDMRGAKLIYIFCNENFKKNGWVTRPPTRDGTRDDAVLLAETFEIFGFQFKIYYDMKFEQIFDILSRVSTQDHKRTSCLWVTIMTHATSNALLAADRSYKLSQIEILLQSANLAGIPKILTLPCIRGGSEGPGDYARPTSQPLQNASATWARPYNTVVSLWYGSIYWIHKFHYQIFKKDCTNCTICEVQNVDDGRIVLLKNGSTIVLPSTADFLFIHAADIDLAAPSILNRAICETFQERQELDHGDLIPIVNQKVANNTDPTAVPVIPETRITLTKTLRFKRIETHRN